MYLIGSIETMLTAALSGVIIMVAWAIRTAVVAKARTGYYFPEASKQLQEEIDSLPLTTLKRIQNAFEWEELDVTQKEKRRAGMSSEDLAEWRAGIEALREWEYRLKNTNLPELIRAREEAKNENPDL